MSLEGRQGRCGGIALLVFFAVYRGVWMCCIGNTGKVEINRIFTCGP